MNLGVQLRGGDDLARSLARVDLDERRIALAAAAPIRARARVVVPKKTGSLAASINLDLFGGGNAVRVVAGAPYAAEVAYGGPSNPRPVPFMEIAVRTTGTAVQGAAASEVEHELRRAGL